MPVPIDRPGKLETIVNVDEPTPDHMDTFTHMPVGLSIGLQGKRELVGVAFDEMGEVFEAQEKLKQDGQKLADLEEFDGREVQRIIQEVGDVTQIAGYATLHSGSPIEVINEEIGPIPNAVFIIGHLSVGAADAQDIVEAHLSKYYKPKGDSFNPGRMTSVY